MFIAVMLLGDAKTNPPASEGVFPDFDSQLCGEAEERGLFLVASCAAEMLARLVCVGECLHLEIYILLHLEWLRADAQQSDNCLSPRL